ncbi:MAG: 1-deoxy-D-xylulose-5-phosphate synthase N-terminal domain-containing protein [Caldisphaera sp.]
MGRGYDAQPILNNEDKSCSTPSLENIYTLLMNKKINVSKNLNEFLKKINNYHADSSRSVLNILLALYNYWVPKGINQGIKRSIILSKGHASPALYVLLSENNEVEEEELESFAMPNSRLQSHPEGGKIPGILFSTGSLGQGLSVANGIAYAARLNNERREIAVILGDGELDEGQIWESISTSFSLKIDNVLAIIDRNGFQLSGPTEEIKIKESIKKKFEAFGWYALEVRNDIKELIIALDMLSEINGIPKALIVKGDI